MGNLSSSSGKRRDSDDESKDEKIKQLIEDKNKLENQINIYKEKINLLTTEKEKYKEILEENKKNSKFVSNTNEILFKNNISLQQQLSSITKERNYLSNKLKEQNNKNKNLNNKNSLNSQINISMISYNDTSNIHMTNNKSSLYYQKNQNMMTLSFNINNNIKFDTLVQLNQKLGDIFILALNQHGYSNFGDIKDFTFGYGTQDLTNYFHDNQEVRFLNFGSHTKPIIDVKGGKF